MKKNLEYYRVIRCVMHEIALSETEEQQNLIFLKLRNYVDSVTEVAAS